MIPGLAIGNLSGIEPGQNPGAPAQAMLFFGRVSQELNMPLGSLFGGGAVTDCESADGEVPSGAL
jgi:hypothetical protein